MIDAKRIWFVRLLLVAVLLLHACSTAGGNGELSAAFDPENPREYGVRGIYLGQGIKEAMDRLKPTKYDFMDAVTRESYTVEQLASGAGTVAMGIVLVDHSQLMVKVRNGVLESIILGGVSETDAAEFTTNRGFALYESVDKLKEVYGEAPTGQEMVYKGSKYQALFSVHDNKVIGVRFDRVQ
jgi:hypothetical protein